MGKPLPKESEKKTRKERTDKEVNENCIRKIKKNFLPTTIPSTQLLNLILISCQSCSYTVYKN